MIKFIQKLNKEHNSLYEISQDDKTLYLSQKDFISLVNQMNNNSDLIEEELGVKELKKNLKESEDKVEELNNKLSSISCLLGDD